MRAIATAAALALIASSAAAQTSAPSLAPDAAGAPIVNVTAEGRSAHIKNA